MANASASMLVWTRDTGMNASCASAPARGGRPCETVSGPADARWLALFGLLLPLFVFFVCLFGVWRVSRVRATREGRGNYDTYAAIAYST